MRCRDSRIDVLQALLDNLVRLNRDLDRLDDLYRAMINVEPDEVIWDIESKQRDMNRTYMRLLSQLKSILRRIKTSANLVGGLSKETTPF